MHLSNLLDIGLDWGAVQFTRIFDAVTVWLRKTKKSAKIDFHRFFFFCDSAKLRGRKSRFRKREMVHPVVFGTSPFFLSAVKIVERESFFLLPWWRGTWKYTVVSHWTRQKKSPLLSLCSLVDSRPFPQKSVIYASVNSFRCRERCQTRAEKVHVNRSEFQDIFV